MDWPIIGKCRNRLWLVVLASFLLWLVLFCFYYSAPMVGDNFVKSVNFGDSNSVFSPGNSNESINELLGTNFISEETDFVKPAKDKDAAKNSYNPFTNFSAGDYGLENFDHIVTKVYPNNQTHIAQNEVDQSVNGVSSLENAEEPDQKRFKPDEKISKDSCSGRYIYVHHLPRGFNEDMLRHCRSLSNWTNMCLFTANMGLGPSLADSERVFSKTSWFATNQFLLEVIFHNRMKQYKCLTNDSSMASAIFVPYYAGLDVSRFLWYSNTSMRDAASLDLVKWLRRKPEWKKMWGRDHFMVAGRITWDFRRVSEKDSDWGNKLMLLPASRNMTMLVIESSPWDNNDFAIPYPTYFHPSSDNEVFRWQSRMRRQKRRYFFSFAGAPRPNLRDSIRTEIIEQCRASAGRKCRLLECRDRANKCYNPSHLMKMFQSSVFCLQPPGDSFTRRSAFDSILAANDVKSGKVSIQKILLRIPKEKVRAMREEVIRLIPRVIYAHPRSRLETLEDAFDITVKGVLERVERIRREMREGKNTSYAFAEEFSWKYNLVGTTVGEHEWDPLFARL
ncbi:probable xyloglucan galactosyltransferase GT11 isoform X2 [Corylus avellana]|uniref:probable xyloglucan galactosyltransferase GT11 isoform X2 n=1 Tax=Corylus avellana TaxID=13451 RepID=UPI00286B865A|nr:probable xyloglucan galactosyltransferase GT11 isoform X2 [Corylus avellana]